MNLQTGKSWHWSRITNSGGCYCHALHSFGCICHKQSSSISLHCKLLTADHTAACRFFLWGASCRNVDAEHLTQPSSKIFQVLCGLTLPVGKLVVDYVLKNHEVKNALPNCLPLKVSILCWYSLRLRLQDNAKIFMAKYYCVRLHALFGMALASGLVLARNGVLAWQMSNVEIHERIRSTQRIHSLPLCSELLIRQQNRLNVENDCSTELVQFCQEMERKCQGGTRCCCLSEWVGLDVRCLSLSWFASQHPVFAQGTRLLRFDWLGLLVHGQITVACRGGFQYELNSKPGRTSHVQALLPCTNVRTDNAYDHADFRAFIHSLVFHILPSLVGGYPATV